MVPKKSKRANLEQKRIVFFEYGIVLTLAFLLFAFESGRTHNENDLYTSMQNSFNIEEEIIPITMPEVEKPVVPIRPEEFIIIDNSEPDIEDVDIDWSSEIGLNDGVDINYYEPEDELEEPEIFVIVEKMPKYKGGTEAEFQRDLQRLVKYPQEAQDLGIQGKVFLKFVIDETGTLTKPEIVQSADQLLSNAVLEALDKTDKWKAGEQRGRKVRVCFTIPVFFRLN